MCLYMLNRMVVLPSRVHHFLVYFWQSGKMVAILMMSVLSIQMEQKAEAQIITPPESTSAIVNEVATFNCSGTGLDIFWYVDEKAVTTEYETDDYLDDNTNTISSTLYIPALMERNNLSIECVVVIGETNEFSAMVYLSVLGIGKIPWIEFDNNTYLFNCVKWGKPYASSDITDLAYYVHVTGKSGYLSNSTSATQFCMEYTFCQEYNITITPYSTNYTGTAISTTVKIDGGSYSWDGLCTVQVSFTLNGYAVAMFTCKLTTPDVVCPDQSVVAVCGSYTKGNSTSVQIGPWAIETILYNDDLIDINVPNLPMAERLFCEFSLKDVDDADLGLVHQNFSTFSIKDISVTMKQASDGMYVTVSALFVTNTSIWGCLVVFKSFTVLKEFNVSVKRLSDSLLLSNNSILLRDGLDSEVAYIFDAWAYDCFDHNCNVNLMEPAITRTSALTLSLLPTQTSIEQTPSPDVNTVSNTPDPHPSTSPKIILITTIGIASLVAITIIVLLAIVLVIVVHHCQKSRKLHNFQSLEKGYENCKPNNYCEVEKFPEDHSKKFNPELCPTWSLPASS